MLVSEIITRARSISDIGNTSFFTPADALFSVNSAWREMYTDLCSSGDDFFSITLPISNSSLVASSIGSHYTFDLPTDFYRVSMLMAGNNNGYLPVPKVSKEDFLSWKSLGYRTLGTKLEVITGTAQDFILYYYPAPIVLADTTDITYPNTAFFEILSYKIAHDIRIKQRQDARDILVKIATLKDSMMKQINRDEWKNEPIRNVFGTNWGY